MNLKNIVVVSYVWVQIFIQQPIEWPHPKQHWEYKILGGLVSSLDPLNMVVFSALLIKSLYSIPKNIGNLTCLFIATFLFKLIIRIVFAET